MLRGEKMLVDGKWQRKWDPVQKMDDQGRFIRQTSSFRERIDDLKIVDEDGLRLYVAYICPWATRTLITRSLLGLEQLIDIKVVDPVLTDFGWQFAKQQGDQALPGVTESAEADVHFMHQLYTKSDYKFTGRATVPALWNIKQKKIINNESSDILSIMNDDLRPLHQSSIDLNPKSLQKEIDAFNESIYQSLNNGVYRAGFASSQLAYQEAIKDIFDCLDQLDGHFSKHQYAMGSVLTQSDIRLFVTLARFDVAYVGLFKTNLKTIENYPSLSRYLSDLLDIKAFSQNTKIDHIKAGYYSIEALNPSGIVPSGPKLSWFEKLESDL